MLQVNQSAPVSPTLTTTSATHTWQLLLSTSAMKTQYRLSLHMLIRKPKAESSPHCTSSWCCLTQSKQSSPHLHRYVKHWGLRVRPYLHCVGRLHGNPQWRQHLLGVSRNQYERYRGEREACGGEQKHLPRYILYIIFLYRSFHGIFSLCNIKTA